MKDGSKLFLMGIFAVLATLFAFFAKISVFAIIALIVLKLSGVLQLSWGLVLIAPPVLFVVSNLLQATFTILLKVVEE